MGETFRTSAEINDVAAALAAAQGEFVPVEKNKTGKVRGTTKDGRAFEYDYKYADIADVLAAALPVLSRHNLCLVQPTIIEAGSIFIRSRLIHGGSGQWLESDYPVCSISGDHQKMGGALTYARRYGGCSLLGIAPEDDVDAQGADAAPATKERGADIQRRPRQQPEVQTPETGRALPPRVGGRDDDIPAEMMFDEVESAEARADMEKTLSEIASRDELRVWVTDNRIAKARLKQGDREAIEELFSKRIAALPKASLAPKPPLIVAG